jgi:hypothetical protein
VDPERVRKFAQNVPIDFVKAIDQCIDENEYTESENRDVIGKPRVLNSPRDETTRRNYVREDWSSLWRVDGRDDV